MTKSTKTTNPSKTTSRKETIMKKKTKVQMELEKAKFAEQGKYGFEGDPLSLDLAPIAVGVLEGAKTAIEYMSFTPIGTMEGESTLRKIIANVVAGGVIWRINNAFKMLSDTEDKIVELKELVKLTKAQAQYLKTLTEQKAKHMAMIECVTTTLELLTVYSGQYIQLDTTIFKNKAEKMIDMGADKAIFDRERGKIRAKYASAAYIETVKEDAIMSLEMHGMKATQKEVEYMVRDMLQDNCKYEINELRLRYIFMSNIRDSLHFHWDNAASPIIREKQKDAPMDENLSRHGFALINASFSQLPPAMLKCIIDKTAHAIRYIVTGFLAPASRGVAPRDINDNYFLPYAAARTSISKKALRDAMVCIRHLYTTEIALHAEKANQVMQEAYEKGYERGANNDPLIQIDNNRSFADECQDMAITVDDENFTGFAPGRSSDDL